MDTEEDEEGGLGAFGGLATGGAAVVGVGYFEWPVKPVISCETFAVFVRRKYSTRNAFSCAGSVN